MSNILAIAGAATASAALAGVSAGQFTHICIALSRADVDLTKIRLTVTVQRSSGQESVIPGITLDVMSDVADALGLGANDGRSIAALQTANAAGAAGSVLPISFALPIGKRFFSGKSTGSFAFSVESALTGTYTAFLFNDGNARAQPLPLQFANADTGQLGRPSMVFAYRTSVGTAAGDVAAATAASLSVTLTVQGEGSHTIQGSQLTAFGAMHDTIGVPTRCVRIYTAMDVQKEVSLSKSGTDAANWNFISVQVPDVPIDDLAFEGAAMAGKTAADMATLSPERRKNLRYMGLAAPLPEYQAQAERFAQSVGKV